MSQIPIIFVHTDAERVDPLLLRALMEHVGPSYDVIDGCTDTESRLQDLRDSGRMVALFVYDQHGVGLHGADFLEETTGLFTESLAILITTHADTDSAIASINRAEIDYYLVKPWKPAEENLLPIVDRLLSEWRESVQMPFIRVKGIMTVRAIRIRERASLQRAAEIVALSGVGDLMVIDDNDQFVGVLSIGDVKDVMNEAFCDSLGNFDCEGRYDLKKCNYINSINEVELTKPENMPCQQISHNINPYQSAEARIMFSTWNLDHV